jgi:16S rRNA (cytosine1402-N4)-methyltransferase
LFFEKRFEVMSEYHKPVFLDEVVKLLTHDGARGGVFLDGTLGGGGHSEALLKSRSDIEIIGIDQDEEAIRSASEKLKPFGERFRSIHANFRMIKGKIPESGLDGVILDLGVSSNQLDQPDRGFSFRQDGPLDMRMDPKQCLTAAEIVNRWDEESLANLFWEFGEERHSRRVAKIIVEDRVKRPYRRTLELAEMIARIIGRRSGFQKIHPATRVFQALRIAVNDEMEALKEGIKSAWQALRPDGRLVVISFHSLEDRIVKHQFKEWANQDGMLLFKKPKEPEEEEIKSNPRARSAKLRGIQKNKI